MPKKQTNSETKFETSVDSLHRSETNKIIAGVAGGLGEYFGIDPTIIRIIFIIISIFGGSGILLYLILWLIIPKESDTNPKETLHSNLAEMKIRARSLGEGSKSLWGIVIILLGIIFLLNNFDFGINLGRLWPVILIAFGLLVLNKDGK